MWRYFALQCVYTLCLIITFECSQRYRTCPRLSFPFLFLEMEIICNKQDDILTSKDAKIKDLKSRLAKQKQSHKQHLSELEIQRQQERYIQMNTRDLSRKQKRVTFRWTVRNCHFFIVFSLHNHCYTGSPTTGYKATFSVVLFNIKLVQFLGLRDICHGNNLFITMSNNVHKKVQKYPLLWDGPVF